MNPFKTKNAKIIMPYAVQSGAKIIGVIKGRRSKNKVNAILASDYRKNNNVRLTRIKGVKMKRPRRLKRARR